MSEFRRKLMMAYAANLGRDNIIYPGLIAAWSAKGKTNEDIDRNVLKDLTGNGHDITLNRFAFSEMSGYGGYNIGMNNGWAAHSNHINIYDTYQFTSTKIHAKGFKKAHDLLAIIPLKNAIWESFKVKYTSNNPNIKCYYKYVDENDKIQESEFLKEGINIIPKSYGRVVGSEIASVFSFNWITDPDFECTLELLPEYPDALVFDGVDDYGVNKNMPILEDFTLIINKNDIANPKERESFYISKSASVGNGAFILGYTNFNSKNTYCNLYGNPNYYNYENGPILYVTPNLFNGSVCSKGSSSDSKTLTIGSIRLGDIRMWTGAFYSAYLFDRSLDEQEIKAFIRKYIDPEYLLPSETAPTPDVYYDFTNGDNSKGEANNVITDLSGNGNDATAHNFAWNEESGYAEGRLKFDGVDDYISLDTFDSVFKTMFMVCTNFEAPAGSILYDQRSELFNKNYSVAYYSSSIAYNNDNINGTYINGTLNTKLACQELNNKKHLIHVVAKDTSESRKPNIGRSLGQNQYSNMMLYKFLGFKEALTEEQIKAVINKYNLLDGVDEIEVS